MAKEPKELKFDQARNFCPELDFKCKSTADLEPLKEIIGQDRAVKALQFGLRIRDKGFNIFVSGAPGTGRKTATSAYIKQLAKKMPVPSDWCYVNNFKDATRPKALELPPGNGKVLKSEMERFVGGLPKALQDAFESTDYAQRRTAALKSTEDARQEQMAKMNKMITEAGFQLVQSPAGLALLPVIDKQPYTDEMLAQMPPRKRKQIETRRDELGQEVQKMFIQMRDLERQAEEKVTKLNREVATYVLEPRMATLRQDFKDVPKVIEYLNNVMEDVLVNFPMIVQGNQKVQGPMGMQIEVESPVKNYQVNLIVDNSKQEGAPVEMELNPTYFRLFGAMEREAKFGALFTDYTMIKAGAAHRANGGFLVVPVEGLFMDGLTYQSLKQTLTSGNLEIEEQMARMGYMVTRSIRPEPIPFTAKVVIIGEPYAYEVLYSQDKDFREMFKVKADFDTTMPRNHSNAEDYASFLCMLCIKENLLHLDSGALCEVIELSSRLVEDQNKLSTEFADVANVVREANFYAKDDGAKEIGREHVIKTIEERIYRSNLIQTKLQEMVDRGQILLMTDGEKVGQVNGLSVIGLWDYAFGHPSRITASVAAGKDGIIDIEREAEMSGPTHHKGVLILGGYLSGTYASGKPLSLTAKLVFEQSYSGVDGDSASSTELYAIISALSGKPIKQYLAVTGSVNQKGEVQAIGGVNEKIEGFYEICKMEGLNGKQGVMIPESNVQNLMLKEEVLDAIKKGKFHIYPVKTINEGIEVLTGETAGDRAKDGYFEEGTVNYLVQQKLAEFAERVKEYRA
ncbi:MAG: AAA family ATPase [Methanomassiliicoccales archaeon]